MNLKELFQLQSTLNARVGLNDEKFAVDFADGEGSVANLIEAGKWIDDMLKAMMSEMEELRNCTYWKHWCSEAQGGKRYMVKDIDAARKEVIDMLHFWISIAQAVGMTPEMAENMYKTKLAKNLKRQDDGYSIQQKDRAWILFTRNRYGHPWAQPSDADAMSLEDLGENVQQYYLDWARRVP